MRTKITKLSAILFFLFALPLGTFAASYPLYLCGGATANLKPDATVEGALAIGDKVMWQEFDGSGAPIGTVTELPVTAAGAAPAFTTAAGLASGEHTYKVFVVSATPNVCTGDVSDPFKLYVLPAATVTLGAPTTANYCEAGSGGTTTSVITATATAIDAALTDVTYDYTWTATKGGSAVSDVTTVGTAATNVFTMNTTATGVYTVKTAIKYVVASGTLKSGDGAGCVQASADSAPITVTPKPGKPTITFS